VAAVVVQALWELMQPLALLAALVVPDRLGRKTIWTTPEEAAAVVPNHLETQVAAVVVVVTEGTMLARH
jgi:hypothetical protein